MQPFLNRYSLRALAFGDEDIGALRGLFQQTFRLALEIFREHTFRPYNLKKEMWERLPKRAVYDAAMVSLRPNRYRS